MVHALLRIINAYFPRFNQTHKSIFNCLAERPLTVAFTVLLLDKDTAKEPQFCLYKFHTAAGFCEKVIVE